MAIFDTEKYLKNISGDIGRVRSLASSQVTGPGLSAQNQLADLQRSQGVALGNLANQQLGSLQTAQNQMQLMGGLSAGANERLARENLRRSGMAQQGLQSDFAGLASDITSADLARQEQQKFQSLMATPQLEQGLTNTRLQAAAANQLAEEYRNASRKGLFGNILGAAGGIVGTVYGGPAGGAAGAAIGKGVGGIFS